MCRNHTRFSELEKRNAGIRAKELWLPEALANHLSDLRPSWLQLSAAYLIRKACRTTDAGFNFHYQFARAICGGDKRARIFKDWFDQRVEEGLLSVDKSHQSANFIPGQVGFSRRYRLKGLLPKPKCQKKRAHPVYGLGGARAFSPLPSVDLRGLHVRGPGWLRGASMSQLHAMIDDGVELGSVGEEEPGWVACRFSVVDAEELESRYRHAYRLMHRRTGSPWWELRWDSEGETGYGALCQAGIAATSGVSASKAELLQFARDKLVDADEGRIWSVVDCWEEIIRRASVPENRQFVMRKEGRVYHALTSIPRALRMRLGMQASFGGGGYGEVVDLDVSSMYWCILASQVRDAAERAELQGVLAAGCFYEEIGEVVSRREASRVPVDRGKLKRLVNMSCLFTALDESKNAIWKVALRHRFPGLARLIGYRQRRRGLSQLSDSLTRKEGQIVVDGCCAVLFREGIPSLPYHDGLLISEERADRGHQLLCESAKRELGFLPNISRKGLERDWEMDLV